MLTKSAMTQPNLVKGKGRYLIVLPGNFCPRVPGVGERTSCVEKPAAPPPAPGASGASGGASGVTDTTKIGSDDDNDDVIEVIDDDGDSRKKKSTSDDKSDAAASASASALLTSAPTTTAKAAPFTPATPPTILGQLEHLGTPHPRLRIPFPDGRVMLLRGRKISTSSSYMALTAKMGGRSGGVTCKDIFAAAIIFGDVGWEDNGEVDEPEKVDAARTAVAAARASSSSSVIAATGDDDGDSTDGGKEQQQQQEEEEEDATRAIRHFGPSERTLDGGKAISLVVQISPELRDQAWCWCCCYR